jgi:hypothetical protein
VVKKKLNNFLWGLVKTNPFLFYIYKLLLLNGMETPLEILMSWIIEQNLNKTIDVADVYFKAKELLEYEKNLLKKDVEILN